MSVADLDVEALSTEERLALIERLWDSLRSRPEHLPLTEEQRDELDRRLDELEDDGAAGIPWDDVLRRLRSRP